ncbi:hypothetical protein A2U01_0101612, partial [Trifolium medium]|nr:hypothetical protein [Trifolium medium]
FGGGENDMVGSGREGSMMVVVEEDDTMVSSGERVQI